jgi:hypothetical protein
LREGCGAKKEYSSSGGLMAYPKNVSWPTRWPGYLPFPKAIRRGWRPVPNQQSVDWPMAQFAPLYLPPGSPSFQQYSYRKNDVPLRERQPHYSWALPPALVQQSHAHRGVYYPDTAALPVGGHMSRSNGGWGWRPNPNLPLAPGVPPVTLSVPVHEPRAAAVNNPLYGGIALTNSGCVGCYGEENWFTDEEGEIKWGPVIVTAGVVALALSISGILPLNQFLEGSKSRAASYPVYLNPRRRRRRKKSRMSKAARSRAAKKGWRTRRRRGR